MGARADWRLLSSHGAALFYIARNPGCTVRDIADALVVTERTVWTVVGHLKRADLIRVRRDGNHHRYWINGHARFPDPVLSHTTLRPLVSIVHARHGPVSECCHPQLAPGAARP